MSYKVGIPLGTKLIGLERDTVAGEWHIWISVKNVIAPLSKWEGTRLVLRADGSIDRITDEPDGSEYIMTIKGPD